MDGCGGNGGFSTCDVGFFSSVDASAGGAGWWSPSALGRSPARVDPISDFSLTSPPPPLPGLGSDVLLRPAAGTDFRVCIGRLAGESDTAWTVFEFTSGHAVTLSKTEWRRCEYLVGSNAAP
jgi:hypothetical protein